MSVEAAETVSDEMGSPRGSVHLAHRMPSFLGSIRFRLASIYSLLLFGLASIAVGVLYTLVARDLAHEPVSQTYTISRPIFDAEGNLVLQQETVQAELTTLERLVNERALEELRRYSFIALGGLLVTSLGVGWVVAGRVLAPIGRIAGVARTIQGTDLSQRIALDGPEDELRDLADTFDDMLDRLESSFEAQRRLVQDASHELRNPLAVMRTNFDVTLADPNASVEDYRRTAIIANRTAQRMSKLVDDLLAYARHGLAEAQWEDVNIAAVVAEVVDEFEVLASTRSLALAAMTDPAVRVMADRNALKQALANLLGNAVRLAPEGTRVVVAGGAQDRWAFLSVADEGPGLSLEQQASVFERFWRAPGQMSAGEPRSGLGLTIVRDIVERHGGRVDVVSEAGQGSTFVVWLPALSDGFTGEPVASQP
ncbi:MAG: sensor histidine kinase [Acidimicrobiales bacterium]